MMQIGPKISVCQPIFQGEVSLRANEDFLRRYLDCVGLYVRRLRGAMSEVDLAKKAKVSRTTIQRIEAGQNYNIRNLLAVANALDVSPFMLIMTAEEKARFDEEQLMNRILAKIEERLPGLIAEQIRKTNQGK